MAKRQIEVQNKLTKKTAKVDVSERIPANQLGAHIERVMPGFAYVPATDAAATSADGNATAGE